MSFFEHYPYFAASSCLLAVCLVFLWRAKPQRRAASLAGLLCMPYAFASVAFVPEYWEPRRVFVLLTGLEDLVFSFAAGCLAWLGAVSVVGGPKGLEVRVTRLLWRYCFWTGVFFAMFLVVREWLDVRPMTALVIGGCTVLALGLAMRRDLWRLSAAGAAVYGIAYSIVVGVVFRIWPDFPQQWNWHDLTGLTLLAVPIEESAYAVVFGAAWPTFMAHAFGARPGAGGIVDGEAEG